MPRCVFWGGDTGRIFDVLAEGQPIGSVNLDVPHPGEFVVRTFPIPTALTARRPQVTVKFQARPGDLAGGLFDLRTVRLETSPALAP